MLNDTMDIKFVHINIISTDKLSKAKNCDNSRKRPPRLKTEIGMGGG